MTNNLEVVLTGSNEDIQSYNGLKILCTAYYTNTNLSIQKTESTTPFQLTIPSKNNYTLPSPTGSTNTILRTLFKLSSSASLTSTSSSFDDDAIQDSWVCFIKQNMDVPYQALLQLQSSENVVLVDGMKKDIVDALKILEKELCSKTFLVGDAVGVSDISIACFLGVFWDICAKEEGTFVNLERLYDTIIHQSFFSLAKATLQELQTNASASTAPAAVVESTGSNMMVKAEPKVTGHKFQRARIRMKELFSNADVYMDKTITVCGWTRTIRNANKGQLLFLELNDGSCHSSLQCVIEKESIPNFDDCKNSSGGVGSSFQVCGLIIPSPAKGQAVEMQVSSVTLLGAVYGGDADGETVGGMYYPLSKKSHSLEFLRENAHLRARTKLHSSVMRIRHAMAYATHKFFNDSGFLYIHTPIITCADCEGAGEQFGVTTLLGSDPHKTDVVVPTYKEDVPPPKEEEGEGDKKVSKSEQKKKRKAERAAAAKKATSASNRPAKEELKVIGAVDYSNDFFSRRANLTVSGQLNVETHACALSDVYTFGPTFRAENSHTGRHLCEFWMIEPEIAFATLEDDLNLAEDYLKYCVKYALEMCEMDLQFLESCPVGEAGLVDRLKTVLDKPFMRITYTEAIDLLQKAESTGEVKFEERPIWGIDLPTEMERYLCETIFNQPTAITDYPKDIKAFYMKLNDDEKTVAAADVLVPKIGEIIGGSQREERLDVLLRRCKECGVDEKELWWYLDLRRYGSVKHAGFGLGFERLILFVTGLENIRDVIPFPRWPGNAEF